LISVIAIPIPSANALSVKVAPAGWTYLFASDTPAKQTATPRVFSVNFEKKSSFVPIYNNVPDVAKASIQQAIDTWSENFVSKVPVKVVLFLFIIMSQILLRLLSNEPLILGQRILYQKYRLM